jgi:hypothetical protein
MIHYYQRSPAPTQPACLALYIDTRAQDRAGQGSSVLLRPSQSLPGLVVLRSPTALPPPRSPPRVRFLSLHAAQHHLVERLGLVQHDMMPGTRQYDHGHVNLPLLTQSTDDLRPVV